MAAERPLFISMTIQDPKPFMEASNFGSTILLEKISPGDRLKKLYRQYRDRIKTAIDNKSEPPQEPILVIEDNPQELIEAAKTMPRGEFFSMSSISRGKKREQRRFFESLTLIQLGAKIHSDRVDAKTGIRVVGITRNEVPFPMHPAPNS